MGNNSAQLSARLRARSTKRNNAPTAHNAKLELRRSVLDAIGASSAVVFDAFAGDGVMHRGVWQQAADYVGCDLVWYRDERLCFVADNRRVLRAIDLSPFNVFDLDAHGSPWDQVTIIAHRRPLQPGERIGLVLTDGSFLKIKFGGYPRSMAALAGLRPDLTGGSSLSARTLVFDRALTGLAGLMGANIVRRWQAKGRTGAKVVYTGLVLEDWRAAAATAQKKGAPEGTPQVV